VTSFIPYDTSYRAPAPVLLVGVARLGSDPVMVPMLVDTGADVTLLAADTVRRLRLPRVDTLVLSGFGGARLEAAVHAATLRFGGTQLVARVVASDEALLGRDVLERFHLELDGPRARLILRTSAPRSPRRRT
jgi:predicted aspartyl protease